MTEHPRIVQNFPGAAVTALEGAGHNILELCTGGRKIALTAIPLSPILQEDGGLSDVNRGRCREFDGLHSSGVIGVVGSTGGRVGGCGRDWACG